MGERMLRRSIVVPSEVCILPAARLLPTKSSIHDELDLLGVEIDVASPPALEAEIARGLGVDLGVEVVLLGPERVCGILILEILNQPGAVELAMTEVARQRGQPAAAQEAAAVAHRILAAHAGPVGERRARDDEGTEELGPHGREHHDGPSSLAIADHAGLAFGIGMQRDDLFKEHCFGARNVLDRLARHGVGQKADEITGMSGLERDADLAVRLEPADARAVPGARIDDNERPAQRIDLDSCGRNDAHQGIIDRSLQAAAVDDELDFVLEHMRRSLREMLAVLIAALAHDVPEQHGPLRRIDHVFHGRSKQPKRGHRG